MQSLGCNTLRACHIFELSRSTFLRKKKPGYDEQVRNELWQLVEENPRIGFWVCYQRLRDKGFNWNHKRIYRVYRLMGLNKRRRSVELQ
jgi:putative transposase